MEVVLYRIDERLIHGQVMVAWLGKTGANCVFIVDDASAADSFMQEVYQLAAPAGIRVEVVTTSAFAALANAEDNRRAIVLFKDPENAVKALKDGVAAGELIVGNMSTSPNRSKYTKYAYISEDEKGMLADLQAGGWKVQMQLLPDDTKSEFTR